MCAPDVERLNVEVTPEVARAPEAGGEPLPPPPLPPSGKDEKDASSPPPAVVNVPQPPEKRVLDDRDWFQPRASSSGNDRADGGSDASASTVTSASNSGSSGPSGNDSSSSSGESGSKSSSGSGGGSSSGAGSGGGEQPGRKAATKKPNRSVFGEPASERPDVLTNAETVVLPQLAGGASRSRSAATPTATKLPGAKSQPTFTPRDAQLPAEKPADASPRGEAPDAVGGQPASKPPVAGALTVPRPIVLPDAITQVFPAIKPDETFLALLPPRKPRRRLLRRAPREPKPPYQRYPPDRQRTMISRVILLAILGLQALLSLHLNNTAYSDEALYQYAGHMELQHWLHHGPLYGDFKSYFAGSPLLYPVLAAALDSVGGLGLARDFSLLEMLTVTALLYSITRYLFNERAGLCAAALFSVTESAIFLGHLATYDATCLCLLAFATWLMVYTARFKWPIFLLAGPIAALAVAVKYSGLLFLPTIALLPPLIGWPERWRRTLWYPIAFAITVADLLFAAVRLGGHVYLTAVESTVTNRAQGDTSIATIARESLTWGGLIFVLALIGTIAYVWRVRNEPDEQIAPAGSRLRRATLGLVLTGTALLAPLYQAHLHTDVSFSKHIGFGLFFAAPMAGFGLARLLGDYIRRPHLGVCIWSFALLLGLVQSTRLYQQWPNSAAYVQVLAQHLKPGAKYLVEAPEVAIYYLEHDQNAQPDQFTSTYSVAPLTTPADFAAAVKSGKFSVIAYDGDVTPADDAALAKALAADHSYYLASKIFIGTTSGSGHYEYIWVKGTAPKSATKAKAKTDSATSTAKKTAKAKSHKKHKAVKKPV
jgi:4-amino-4-deoxy-L-arabinose transferase-like glycosyltransferase